ncbi:hypothetical protein RB195_021652 [Necator americanus]|uniref:Uncharacterized protein n=1 Tax=Necator americanus TaxID=51031 RepID=A0ABR1ED38_NECAM
MSANAMLVSSSNVTVATKHCGQKIRECRSISLAVGILAVVLLISNILTVIYVNRRFLLRQIRRSLGIIHDDDDDDDMRRNIITSD